MTHHTFLIDAAELHSHLAEPGWRIVDCRFDLMQPERGFADYQAGHIPGAVYAHLDRDLAAPRGATTGRHPLPPPATFAETLGRWGITADTRVVVYDYGSGAIAARLWWMLRWMGHSDVALLDAGYAGWTSAGYTVSSETPQVRPAHYAGNADAGMVVTTGEVVKWLCEGGGASLLDARDAERFRGEREPIDPVAGHIPGAGNLPVASSLNSDGSWKSRDELRELWSEALQGRQEMPWIAMCGSGVTACHLALSAQLAGYAMPRLYAGSWSEWIRDSDRPVAVGG
jgi:thiosulfate/3-mercaptopyruvate sulfurtransferase